MNAYTSHEMALSAINTDFAKFQRLLRANEGRISKMNLKCHKLDGYFSLSSKSPSRHHKIILDNSYLP